MRGGEADTVSRERVDGGKVMFAGYINFSTGIGHLPGNSRYWLGVS
jgi:hypothetical protein